mgnify:CR=1 FL=1
MFGAGDAAAGATISAIVKDSANRTMANQQVEFSTTDTGARLQIVSARTDVSGVASATLSIADQPVAGYTIEIFYP